MEAVTLLAKVLKMDETELKGMLESDSSDVTNKVDSLQVYTKEEIQTKLLNHTQSLRFSSLPESLKQEAKEVLKDELSHAARGAALEQKEKEIAAKYGIESYDRFDDLISQIHNSAKTGDAELHTQITGLRDTLEKEKDKYAEELKKEKERFAGQIAEFELNNRLSVYEGRFDIPEEDEARKKDKEKRHLDYLKFEFNKEYKIVSDENGTPVVQDHNGNIVRDDKLHSPLSVSAVIDKLVKDSPIPIKESRKIDGRGGNGGASGGSDDPHFYKGVDISKFESFDAFLASETGKGMKVGSPEANEVYGKFLEAKKAS